MQMMLSVTDEIKQSMEYDSNLAPSSSPITDHRKKSGSNGILHMDVQSAPHALASTDTERVLEQKHDTLSSTQSAPRVAKQHEASQQAQLGIDQWKEVVLDLLRKTTCYSLMPESGKCVVFDANLPIKHAFRALAENDIKCAPVWHSSINKGEGDFIGFMTVTDFADILHFYYGQDLNSFRLKIGELESSTVGRWCTFRKKKYNNKTDTNFIQRAFVHVEPTEPIFNAIHRMHEYFIHRMPVKHNKSILCILNHQTILRFVFAKTKQYHSSLDMRVKDLRHTLDAQLPPTITYEQKVFDAITILSTNKTISAIPICQQDSGIVLDAFMRSDIRFFARNQQYLNLDINIKEFLSKFRPPMDYVPKCTENDNLLDILCRMLSKRCHVGLILDEKKKLVNVLNYYSVFQYIMRDQPAMDMKQRQQYVHDDNQVTSDLLDDSEDITNHFTSQE
eukprot:CAMPEP_0197020152 /NCGR_PEP_ID=MMETSP1384-20130603/860_1 /TAXON_ID=29189 /ORGANISM="Ammonia sp." /LENGTH=448 /DNA_ID=CAMNT_0042447721 /DNA_START=53 /DNA_END=1399 /DNA_ORIENTATION=-